MSWTPLPTDYKDCVWDGLRKYTQIDNVDGTVSFRDVTNYTNREKSFFGAKEANRMNETLNKLMTMENLDSVLNPKNNDLIHIHDGVDLKVISYEILKNSINKHVIDTISPLLFENAGAHNAIYRGKYLGNSVTSSQYTAISSGKFTDLYIGDYWTINDVNYRIAAFDYYLNNGDTKTTKHHVVIVPDSSLYNYVMNDTNTTVGGYVGSKMYKQGLTQAKTIIKTAFSNHVLSHRIYLTNAMANGRPSAGAWCDSEVDLMCEEMVYGGGIFSPTSDGINISENYQVEKSQLPLFTHEPSRICNRNTWWLRNVITSYRFATVNYGGLASCDSANSTSLGVRPVFCIS